MSFLDIFLIGVALSMDAFAVSVCKGLSVKKAGVKHVLTVGVYFGGFQALMPMLGFLLGYKFESFITNIDHWIAFVLLAIIGGNMIREALGKDEDDKENDDFSFRAMLPLAVATSIDALAVGISFAFLGVDIVTAALLIGATTFVLSGRRNICREHIRLKIQVQGRARGRHRAYPHRREDTARAPGHYKLLIL